MNLTTAIQSTITSQTVVLAKAGDLLGDLAVNLVVSILILTLAIWISGWAAKLVRRALNRLPGTHHDATLAEFFSSFARYVVVVIGIIAILRRLGVETTSIITVLGAASLAIGLALQGALGNVAAGVMVLVFRPYRVGDFVTIAGKTGTVKHFDLFNTEIHDADNLKIVVPNGKAFGDVVTNYTDVSRRRIELVFGIGYEDSIETALELAKACAAADARIHKDPAPWAKVTELAPSTVNITLRCWTEPEGYWDTRYDLLRAVKERFDAEGVSLPYPTTVTVNAPANTPPASEQASQGRPERAP